jgi:hypothetical protein
MKETITFRQPPCYQGDGFPIDFPVFVRSHAHPDKWKSAVILLQADYYHVVNESCDTDRMEYGQIVELDSGIVNFCSLTLIKPRLEEVA